MSDLSLTQAQQLIQEYKAIIRLIEEKTKEFQNILDKENINSKELEKILDQINETKEEFDSSSFAILKKNKELFDKSVTILQKIDKMSNMLSHLEKQIEKEKVNFDKDIKQKFDNLLSSLKSSISSLNTQISTEKSKTEKEFKSFRENIGNELQNTKKVISREENELKAIRKQYEEKLENSLNSFKEKIDEYDEEIAKKTFFQRWGAVIGAFAFGVAISSAFLLIVPTINKTQPKTNKTNPKAVYKTEYFCKNETPINTNVVYYVYKNNKLIPVYNLNNWNGIGVTFKINETKTMLGIVKNKDKTFYELKKGKYILPSKDEINCYSKKVEIKSQ